MKKIPNPTKTVRQNGNLFVRATIDTSQVVDTDEEKSFPVVFATETPIARYSWINDEKFNEILVCNPVNIRKDRLDTQNVPLLDNHDQWSGAAGQLGRVDSYTIANGECRAKILFSLNPDNAGMWKDIKAGIIKGISAGYRVFKYLREEVINTDTPNYRAIDWEPMEISLAPVPADFNSSIREDQSEGHEVIIENFSPSKNRRSNMEQETTQENGGGQTQAKPTNTTQERGAESTAKPVVVDEQKVRNEAAIAERQRNTEIISLCRSVNLPSEFAEKLVNDGVTIDNARKAVIDEIAKKDKNTTGGPNASARGDESQGVRNAMIDGLMHRAQPGSVELKDQAHDFKHMRMIDLARICLERKGERVLGISQSEMIGRAIAISDYPNILGTTVQRFLRKFYEAQSFAWKNIATAVSAPDFRQRNGLAVSGKITFEEISEGGQYKNSQLLTEENASIKLKTYGRKITIGRKAIINDDLGVFNYLPMLIAQGASLFQADKVWGLLTGNAKTPDGQTMFHATHGNLASGAGAVPPTIDSLSKARTAFRKIKTPAGDYMPLVPKYLVVPAELETVAEQLMTSLLANIVGNINPFTGKFQILTDPHLTSATEWYLSADPSTFQSLVYAYLEGQEGLHVESKVDFDTDAVVTKSRLDFDCAAWDYRGWYKNPGA